MHFAYPLPWWALVLLVASAVLVALMTYDVVLIGPKLKRGAYGRVEPGPAMDRRGSRRLLPAGLRATALLLLLMVLFRPLVVANQRSGDAIVPILVDQSRSMRIADVDGRRRVDVAVDALRRTLLPRLAGRFEAQVYGFGDAVSAAGPDAAFTADEGRTDLRSALRAMGDRYQDRALGGVVVISDGGITDVNSPFPVLPAPVFTIGIGGLTPDREVKSLTASDGTLASSLIDLDASVISRGFGSQPFEVRLVAHTSGRGAASSAGTIADVRRVVPADGVATHVRFSAPSESTPTVYSVEIPPDSREAVPENNSASVLITPPGRKRRVLFVEGAPGFEHSFLRRAWGLDPGIEVDSVVRKGKNEQGQDAYLVQADAARAPALMTGYPTTKAGLFGYDAIVFGNVEWDFLTRDQLAMTADFVRERGGGVLVLGARSFASPGLAGTPLDDALPLALATTGSSAAGDNKLRLTSDGRDAAMMRIAASADDNDRQWAALPPLAAVNILGAPKPGASVLAVADVNGAARPVLAVQRYGRGRTVEFAGEGAWHWKMLMPAPDRTHELFWRQVVRWLSFDAPDPVTLVPVQGAQPGVPFRVDVLAADGEYHPAVTAAVTVRITAPDGQTSTVTAPLADQASGRYSVPVTVDRPGVYRVEAEARQRSQLLGTAERVFLAGGADPEFADPGLNEAALERVAAQGGGRYVRAGEVATVPDLLQKSVDSTVVDTRPRDIWQHPLVFAAITMLLAVEWVLRRKRGLA